MSELDSYSSAINEINVELIRGALERHAIEPQEAIIVGSAVMGIYGIRDPHDVDAIILPSRFQRIDAGSDPKVGGIERDEERGTLRTSQWTVAENGLKLEMIRPESLEGMTSMAERDSYFSAMLLSPRVVCTSGIYHQTLRGVLEAKREISRGFIRRLKDKSDIKLIEGFLRG